MDEHSRNGRGGGSDPRGGKAALTSTQLRSAAVLADLAGFKLHYGVGTAPSTPFRIPDRAGKLRKAPNLLVDDAPWLDGRVDKSADGHLPVVHSSISAQTALRLGARALSSAVKHDLAWLGLTSLCLTVLGLAWLGLA
jgi:hypothetical protein